MSVVNQTAIDKLKDTKEGEMVKIVLIEGSEVVGYRLQLNSSSIQLKIPIVRSRKKMISGGHPVTIFLSQISDVLLG